MEIWLDTVNLALIHDAAACGLVAGVTTNPSILARAAEDNLGQALRSLLKAQSGPLAVQVTADETRSIVEEARALHAFSDRIVVKIFADKSGYAAMRVLADEEIPVLATGVLEPTQALLAAQLGAAYIAPYVSHMGAAEEARKKLETMVKVLRAGRYDSQLLAASLRTVDDIIFCAELGVGAVTIKDSLFESLTAPNARVEGFYGLFIADWSARHGNARIRDLLNKDKLSKEI